MCNLIDFEEVTRTKRWRKLDFWSMTVQTWGRIFSRVTESLGCWVHLWRFILRIHQGFRVDYVGRCRGGFFRSRIFLIDRLFALIIFSQSGQIFFQNQFFFIGLFISMKIQQEIKNIFLEFLVLEVGLTNSIHIIGIYLCFVWLHVSGKRNERSGEQRICLILTK